MKYKEGQVVRVKNHHNKTCGGKCRVWVEESHEEYKKYKKKVTFITLASDDTQTYYLAIDGGEHGWSECMFELYEKPKVTLTRLLKTTISDRLTNSEQFDIISL